LGQWVNVDTIQLNFPSGLLVPTINPTSISGTNGKINTMIAPIYGMKGDTMIVTARLWTPYNKIYLVRSLVPTREIGFLPGDHTDKASLYEIPYKNMVKYIHNRYNFYFPLTYIEEIHD
jgi:predicted ribonuclease YlaK